MNEIQEITEALRNFSKEREWEQFHNPKDLALAISIEAGELLELFLWKDSNQVDKSRIKAELADVFAFALLMAQKLDLDIKEIILEKLKVNATKYPVDKSKGNSKKYTEL